jgi:hypothetical protein
METKEEGSKQKEVRNTDKGSHVTKRSKGPPQQLPDLSLNLKIHLPHLCLAVTHLSHLAWSK